MDEPQFLFFQLPAVLPLAKKPDASVDAKKGSNKTVPASKLEEVPEGRIGKILVYKSGKVKMKLGDLLFDVSARSPEFYIAIIVHDVICHLCHT